MSIDISLCSSSPFSNILSSQLLQTNTIPFSRDNTGNAPLQETPQMWHFSVLMSIKCSSGMIISSGIKYSFK
ncbi:MAG: hypothetical protein WCP46_00515 [Alphaproteobacteria bacterium]